METVIRRKRILRKMNICRFCFCSDADELTNIYHKEPKVVPLPIQIMSCVSIEVFANDGLPQLICNNCKQQTTQSYIFRSNCKKADDALKNFLQTGELLKPEIQKLQSQKRPLPKISPIKDVKVVSKNVSAKDPLDVKKMKLDDGTEVITLCISQSDEAPPSQDETSKDSEQPCAEPSNSDTPESEDDALETLPYKRAGKTEQVETDIFSCEFCEKTFPLEQLLDIHIANYHRERQFSCPNCDNRFFSKSDMMKHQQTHRDFKPYTCSVCGKVFGREALLRRHEETHVDTPKYMCTECEKTFLVKDDLDAHMKKHDKQRPFSCTSCNKSFVFKQGLERHKGSVHAEDKPFKCNYCEAAFNTPIRLTRHITTHAGLRPYPCKICGRTFLLSHHLTRHMRSHYGKQPEETLGQHKCDICSMSFRRKDSLINHNAIHSMVNLRCVICNTSFEDAITVKDHITTHLQGLPFPCEQCDYSFDTEKQLIEHEMKHAEMEYEEQIEQEVISEVIKGKNSLTEESEVDEDEVEGVSSFHISDMDDPTRMVPTKYQSSSSQESPEPTATIATKENQEEESDGLTHFFKTETASAEDNQDEASHITGEDHDEEEEDKGIKPIYRLEGTKMYQRKGPIKRKIPRVQAQAENVHTAAPEEINERPNMRAIRSDALSNLPAKKPVNVKVGDRMVKVQKFIISKEEMKNMAKLGILEVKNGHVIMKTPGQPILNATIKPVQQSDIENLIFRQKAHQNKPQIKQYERKGSSSQHVPSQAAVESIVEDFD